MLDNFFFSPFVSLWLVSTSRLIEMMLPLTPLWRMGCSKSPPYIEDVSFLLSHCPSDILLCSAVIILKGRRKAGYIRLVHRLSDWPCCFSLYISHPLPSPLRGLRPGRHPEEDDIVPELARSIHPRERPDWEETISAMVRSQVLSLAQIQWLPPTPYVYNCSSKESR